VTGFGEYALVVRVDEPAVIETVIPELPVDMTGIGDVIGVDEDPQPKDEPARRASIKRAVGIRMFCGRSKNAPPRQAAYRAPNLRGRGFWLSCRVTVREFSNQTRISAGTRVASKLEKH
jgi:hypothetical protein